MRLLRPPDATSLYVFAHGAGAGMDHHLMEDFARALAAEKVATLRWNFPYMAAGKGAPDRAPVLEASVHDTWTRATAEGLPLFAGGRSMGGRMASHCAARGESPGLRGLVFFAFPLHPAGAPSSERARHLPDVDVPMLFLQGTRDALAERRRLRALVRKLGATLHEIDEGDHAFAVPKRTGKTAAGVLTELAQVTARWMAQC